MRADALLASTARQSSEAANVYARRRRASMASSMANRRLGAMASDDRAVERFKQEMTEVQPA
jgi:hypothetical protein